MTYSPIAQSPEEIIQFRNDISDLKRDVALIQNDMTWIREKVRKREDRDSSLGLIVLQWIPGLLALAAVGFLALKGLL